MFQPLQQFDFSSSPKLTNEVMSPKSKNKFIIGSLMSVLEQIIMKIALRKISSVITIKSSHIYYFESIIDKIAKRFQ